MCFQTIEGSEWEGNKDGQESQKEAGKMVGIKNPEGSEVGNLGEEKE